MRVMLVRAVAGMGTLIAAFPLQAEEKKSPVTAIKAARLFDGKSDELVRPGVVLVEGSRIVAAGPAIPIPEGANVIDLGDATLSPGFIDAHTHLTGEYNDDWNRAFVNGFRREVAEQAIGAAVNARAVVEAGFTTVRDVGIGRPRSTSACGTASPAGWCPGRGCSSPCTPWAPAAATPTATGSATTCSARTARPRASPTGPPDSARRCGSR